MKEYVNFDFLDNVEIQEVDGTRKSATSFGKVQKNPEGNCIRLFADGKVYPSKDLVNAFDLEYKSKDDVDQGYGFDVFHAREWGQWPADKPSDIIFITPVDRNEPKLDLFNLSKHDENGLPKTSVLDQGSASFGKSTLISMVENVLGEEIFANGQLYLDLEIVIDKPLKLVKNGIYHLPTLVTKGKNKGQMSYKRRENLVIYPLKPLVKTQEENISAAPTSIEEVAQQNSSAPAEHVETANEVTQEAAAGIFGN